MRTDPSHPPSPRLRAVAELIPADSRVADVGTDHARLPRLLLDAGRALRCVACDRDPAALARARCRAAVGLGGDRLELRLGDGLRALLEDDRLDVLVVAGLGAATIRAILDPEAVARLGVRRLVVQPQTEAAALRREFVDRGYAIVDERLVRDGGRFYTVIAAEPGRHDALPAVDGLTADDVLEAGPILLRSGHPAVREYWEGRLARLERILRAVGAERAGATAADAARARRVLRALGPATSAPGG